MSDFPVEWPLQPHVKGMWMSPDEAQEAKYRGSDFEIALRRGQEALWAKLEEIESLLKPETPDQP